MLGIALSNLTGFLREMVIAALYGAGPTADAFFIAFTVPEFLFLMLPLVVGPALLPLLAEYRQDQGERVAANLLGAVAALLLLLLSPLALLAALGAPLYLPLLAPGFGPEALRLSGQLTRLMLPAIVLMGLAAALSAALNARRRFALPALATAAYNSTLIVVALLAHQRIGVRALAWGVLLGAGAALALQLPQALRLYGRGLVAVRRQAGLRRFLRLAGPLALGFFLHYAATLVDRALASTLAAGTVSALNFSYRTALVVGQLLGVAVSTALFPELADQVAQGDGPGLRRTLSTGLRWILLGGLPAAVGLLVLRRPVIQLLFQRGAFGSADTAITASLLAYYTWGILFDALCQPLWRVLYARQEVWVTVGINALKTALRVVLDLVLVQLLGYNGLAVSFALGFAVQFLVLALVLDRRAGPVLNRDLGWYTLRVGLASATGGAAAWLVAGRLDAAGSLAVVAAGGLAGLATFAGAAYVLGIRLFGK